MGYSIYDRLFGFYLIAELTCYNNIGINSLPFDVMRVSNYCTFHHSLIAIDGIFNFGSTKSMSTYIDNIIYSANDSIQTLAVALGSITGKIHVLIVREISNSASFMISIGSTEHGGPWEFDTQIGFFLIFFDNASIIIQ